MLQINKLDYSIGNKHLLKQITWNIPAKKRAALIGENGCGKTTLLRILASEIEPSGGSVKKPNKYTIGYLPQEERLLPEGTVLDTALKGQNKLVEIEQKLLEARQSLDLTGNDNSRSLTKLDSLEHEFEAGGGYQLEIRAKALLGGLGFLPADFSRNLSDLSGGWRMRVYLARLLLQNPDLLLLDEPSNHLDLPSLEWLEKYLLGFSGSIILVSHDRFFIDRLAQSIFELVEGELEQYPGNYEQFKKLKEDKILQQTKLYNQQARELKKQEKFIERFRYKATKAAAVQSRIKQVSKIELIAPVQGHKQLSINLSVAEHSYFNVLTIEDLSFRYETEWIFQNTFLAINRGDKIALIGKNGSGKTTLTRLIVQQLIPQKGILKIGKNTSIGYYAQHQIDCLHPENSVFEEVAETVAVKLYPKIRDTLGIFGFSNDDVHKKIKVLSGGEKARVSLAKILISPVNFLIMDEPTNHLDEVSKFALEEALKVYNGTLILISHDRYFLDKIVNRVIEIKAGSLNEYQGNYSYYLDKKESLPQTAGPVKEDPAKPARKAKEDRKIRAIARQSISKERQQATKKINCLEAEIESLEQKKSEIEKELIRPSTLNDSKLIVKYNTELAKINKQLKQNFSDWENSQLQLEELLEQLKHQ